MNALTQHIAAVLFAAAFTLFAGLAAAAVLEPEFAVQYLFTPCLGFGFCASFAATLFSPQPQTPEKMNTNPVSLHPRTWIKEDPLYLLAPYLRVIAQNWPGQPVQLVNAEFTSSNPENWTFFIFIGADPYVCDRTGFGKFDDRIRRAYPEDEDYEDWFGSVLNPERLTFHPGETILDNSSGTLSIEAVCRELRIMLERMNHGKTCKVCTLDGLEEDPDGVLNDLMSCLNEHAPDGYWIDFLPDYPGCISCMPIEDEDGPETDTVTLLEHYAGPLFNTADPVESFGDYFDPEEFRAIREYLETRYPDMEITGKEEQGFFGVCEATRIRGQVAEFTVTRLPQ